MCYQGQYMALRNANEVKILRPYKKRNFVIHTVRMLAVATVWTCTPQNFDEETSWKKPRK